jgi:hypothetical protein
MLRFRLNVRQRATKGNNLSLRDVSVLPEILEPEAQTHRRANQCRFALSDVRFGSKADMAIMRRDVRFAPESRHSMGCLSNAIRRSSDRS